MLSSRVASCDDEAGYSLACVLPCIVSSHHFAWVITMLVSRADLVVQTKVGITDH